MKIKIAARVDKGARPYNDDRAMIGDEIVYSGLDETTVRTPALAVVCDGCGGYQGGGVAAETALAVLRREKETLLDGDEAAVERVFQQVEREIDARKAADPALSSMCSTVVGCVFREDAVLFFHAGDSRCYRCDSYGMAKMTVDHSLVQEMVDLGRLTEEEALVHPRRNVITRCLGVHGVAPEVHVAGEPIWEEETYLLCSDGFWEAVPPAQVRDVLSEDLTLQEKADRLVDLAIELGSDDNVTVCLCQRLPEGEN